MLRILHVNVLSCLLMTNLLLFCHYCTVRDSWIIQVIVVECDSGFVVHNWPT